MADNAIQIRITSDLSAVKDQFTSLEGTVQESFRAAAGGVVPLDRAILNNRESVRLLSEEMGLKLPRAVSGAIAEVVPAITLKVVATTALTNGPKLT